MRWAGRTLEVYKAHEDLAGSSSRSQHERDTESDRPRRRIEVLRERLSHGPRERRVPVLAALHLHVDYQLYRLILDKLCFKENGERNIE